jgi:hypothetical protein
MDLTDEQWEILEPLIPDSPRSEDGRGRPWRDPRDVLNGISTVSPVYGPSNGDSGLGPTVVLVSVAGFVAGLREASLSALALSCLSS